MTLQRASARLAASSVTRVRSTPRSGRVGKFCQANRSAPQTSSGGMS
jgi:hypothetical protein